MTDPEFDTYEEAWAALRKAVWTVNSGVHASFKDREDIEAWSRIALNIARTLDILKEHPK